MAELLDFNDAGRAGRERHDTDWVADLKRRLEARAVDVLSHLLPGGRIYGPRNAPVEFQVGSIGGERGDSMKISLRPGRIGVGEDFATGERVGDLIDIWMKARGLEFMEAMREAEEWLGNPFARRSAQVPQVTSTPDDLGPPTAEYRYTDEAGSILAIVYRYDPPGRRKEFRPWDAVRRKHTHPDPRPLYNRPGIAASGHVVLAEGEKAADALIRRGIVATSAMGGANAPTEKTDWSPLRGRHVLIWPDADDAGRAYADRALEAVRQAGAATVTLLQPPPTAREGWDAADAVAEGFDVEAFLRPAWPRSELVWFHDVEPSLSAADFVEGLLCDGQMSVVYGAANCGKTFFALDLALHAALGEPWFGRETSQGGVVYCALEGTHGIRNRIAAFRRHRGLDDQVVPFAVLAAALDLLNPRADLARLIGLVEQAAATIEGPVRMLVIDTLSRALSGGDENASEDMGALVRNADAIRSRTGVHLMWVHHTGKDTTRGARGHSLLRAAVDTEIEVSADENSSVRTAAVAKQRDLEIQGNHIFRLIPVELGTNHRGKPVTSCVVQPIHTDAEGEQKARRKPLNPTEKRAMQAIRDLVIALDPEPQLIDFNRQPFRAVDRDAAREHLIKHNVIVVEDQTRLTAQERTKLSRLLQGLIEKGAIEMQGDRLWLAEKR